jgi:hypothetical protein
LENSEWTPGGPFLTQTAEPVRLLTGLGRSQAVVLIDTPGRSADLVDLRKMMKPLKVM